LEAGSQTGVVPQHVGLQSGAMQVPATHCLPPAQEVATQRQVRVAPSQSGVSPLQAGTQVARHFPPTQKVPTRQDVAVHLHAPSAGSHTSPETQ
jgi:hypothetical protein